MVKEADLHLGVSAVLLVLLGVVDCDFDGAFDYFPRRPHCPRVFKHMTGVSKQEWMEDGKIFVKLTAKPMCKKQSMSRRTGQVRNSVANWEPCEVQVPKLHGREPLKQQARRVNHQPSVLVSCTFLVI